MEDEKIVKLRQALEAATPVKPKATRRKTVPSQAIEGDNNMQTGSGKVVRQSIKGSGNVQVAGGVNSMTIRTPKAPKIELTPPPGSIGANPALRLRIEGLIKQIEEYRYQRLGKSYKFGSVHGDLARSLGYKSADWRNVWLEDESSATQIITWLEEKRDNTQQGRIEKAAKRPGFNHSRGQLFRQEGDYLKQLDWDDGQAKERRHLVTGKSSRADMSDPEFRNWVGYLRREVEKMYGEATN